MSAFPDTIGFAIAILVGGRGLGGPTILRCEFMPRPPDVYYEMSLARLAGHGEPIERMRKHGILIDGESTSDGAGAKLLLQIFSTTVIGPIFFELSNARATRGLGKETFAPCSNRSKKINPPGRPQRHSVKQCTPS
jgi:hypothetical protein